MTSELTTLKQRVEDIIAQSPLKQRVDKIDIEPGRGEGSDFLRVTIELKSLSKLEDAHLENVLEQIEDALIAIDERMPSVRFAEPA